MQGIYICQTLMVYSAEEFRGSFWKAARETNRDDFEKEMAAIHDL